MKKKAVPNNYINNLDNNKISNNNNNKYSSFKSQKENGIKKPNRFISSKLSINRDISLIIESSYDNCNIITKQRLIKDKILQEKLKMPEVILPVI